MSHPEHYDVAVIGAGFAGVTAARDLSSAGHRVLLLEARDRLGGRTWYERDRIEGFDVEMGGGWLGDDEKYAMAEVQRYDIPLLRDDAAPGRLLWRHTNGLREGVLPVPFEQLGALETAVCRMQAAAGRVRPDMFTGGGSALESVKDLEVPLPDLFADLDLPTETRCVLEGFWAGISSADWSGMSALLAARLIAGSGGTFMGFMGTVMLGPRFMNGTVQLLEAMASDAEADIRLNSPVHHITDADDAVEIACGDTVYSASAVVCTVPLHALSQITFNPPLSQIKQEAMTRGHSGRGFKLWMVARNASGGIFCLGAPGPFNHLFTVDERDDLALVVGFGAGPCPDPGDHEAVQALLREYLPEADLVSADAHDWTSDPYSRSTWAVYPAGFTTGYEQELRRTENRIVFAGADISEERPGYIDGAIQSGARAAAEAGRLVTARPVTAH